MNILDLHADTVSGLAFGSRLAVPEAMTGVVIKDGKPLDVLLPGEHTLEASGLPLTMQKLKIKPGFPPAGPLPAVLFLVRTSPPFVVPWRCHALLSKNSAFGVTYTTLAGHATVQVSDPARFCSSVLSASSAQLASGGTTPAQAAQDFLRGGLQAAAAEALPKLNIPPEKAPAALEAIRTAAGSAAASWLSSVGMHCSAFDLDTVSAPSRTPCVVCKSATAPTGYGLFQRVISLVYVRFTAKKEGNFCVPCALKTSAAFNSVMLVAGWWGLIGLVLTPVYFFQNLYYLTRIMTGAKSDTLTAPRN